MDSRASAHASGKPCLIPSTDLRDSVTMGENDAAEGAKPWSDNPLRQKSGDAHVAFQASVGFDLVLVDGCVCHLGVGESRISSVSSEGKDRMSR